MPAVRSSSTWRRWISFAASRCKRFHALGSFAIRMYFTAPARNISRVNHRLCTSAVACLAVAASLAAQAPQPYDVLIKGGRVLDGSGNPWLAADIGIRGARIVDMGRLGNAAASRVIDARGLTVSPGFIDVHSHASDGLVDSLKDARQLIAQGITTVALNPDGGGPVDLRGP